MGVWSSSWLFPYLSVHTISGKYVPSRVGTFVIIAFDLNLLSPLTSITVILHFGNHLEVVFSSILYY